MPVRPLPGIAIVALIATGTLAELYRGAGRNQALDALLARESGDGLLLRDTDRTLARLIGALLTEARASSALFADAHPVAVADLSTEARRWPHFAPTAQAAGFAAVQALPMRLREQTIGALNLFRAEPGPLDPADLRIIAGGVGRASSGRDGDPSAQSDRGDDEHLHRGPIG